MASGRPGVPGAAPTVLPSDNDYGGESFEIAYRIDDFVDPFIASGRQAHMLVCNAGVMATPLVRDALPANNP